MWCSSTNFGSSISWKDDEYGCTTVNCPSGKLANVTVT